MKSSGGGDSILWLALALVLIVVATTYWPVIKGMVLVPGYYAKTVAAVPSAVPGPVSSTPTDPVRPA